MKNKKMPHNGDGTPYCENCITMFYGHNIEYPCPECGYDGEDYYSTIEHKEKQTS